jgi:Na+/H+ antiporter NhaD/arsenite permease-like protein
LSGSQPQPNAVADAVTVSPRQALMASLTGLFKDKFFLILLAVLVLLSAAMPSRIASYPALVDWPTIAALTGLLVLTKGLELSGCLHWLGLRLIGLMSTEHSMALCLVVAAALLSTLLTNDVALFVLVPLTLGVCRITGIPATRLVIFEALAVNAGSALTPIGNPQNLYLWQLSQVSFATFVVHMLPLVAALVLALLVLTASVFSSRPVRISDDNAPPPLERALLGVSLGLYLPFLVATDLHYAGFAAGVVLLVFLGFRPRVLALLDWGLLLVFVLMFIDLRLVANLDVVRDAMRSLGLEQPLHLYVASIAVSQAISNVPAAIALAQYSTDWRVIAYGVNIGGFGLMVGSLANLIALRMAGDRTAWLRFHVFAIPFLGLAAVLGYGLLFLWPVA